MNRQQISFLLVLVLLCACSGMSAPSPELQPPSNPTSAIAKTASPPPIASTAPVQNPTTTVTSTASPPPTQAPESVSFYRIRVEFQTTSDWSVLSALTPGAFLSVRLLETIGEPLQPQAGISELSLGQPLQAAEAGLGAGMQVDYALSPETLSNPIEFTITKGDIGGSTVKLYQVLGDELIPLQSINHSGNVPGSVGLNPKNFRIDVTALDRSAVSTVQIPSLTQGKMLWAFYYPWYSTDDWSSSQLLDHPITPYSSSDRDVLTRHIEQAKSAGIDGFISSWWGPDSPDTEPILRTLLDQALLKNFKIAIYFETLAGQGGSPLGEEEITRWLDYVIRKYGSHPAFYKLDGKPLIVIWASGTVPLDTWARIFASLRADGLDAAYLSMGYNLGDLKVFDGFHEYGVFNDPDLARTDLATGRAVRYASLLADEPVRKLWVATAQPGYDDTLLSGREGLVKERDGGDYYRYTFEAALQSDPDWIFITSWNEWWENTHIEPSQAFGNLYLKITKEYSDRWKAR